MALHPILSPTNTQTIARLGVTALRTAQSMQTRKGGSAFYPTGDGQGVLVGDMADHGVDKWDPITGEQNPLWEGISQEELDAKGEEILGAAKEDTAAQITIVNNSLAAASQKIDDTATKTLAAASKAAEDNLKRVEEEIAGEGGKIEQAANAAYERAKDHADALKAQVDADFVEADKKIDAAANAAYERAKDHADALKAQVDADLVATGEAIDAAAEKALADAKADTAQHIAQVNRDIAAASQKIDDTAAKTLADANKAAAAQVAAVDAKVATAQAKADANAAAIGQTNKTVEANKKAADAAQAQLNKTLTEHGSVLTSVNKDIAQAKKDILANTTKATSAESKAEAASQSAAAATSTATSAASTASNAISVANTTAELVKQYGDRSVVSSVIEYAVSTSNTVAPGECVTWWEGTPNDSVSVLTLCWGTAMPEHKTGEYTWMRTRLTYGDGSGAVSAPALITGDKGVQGLPGAPGAPGGQGVSVTAVTNFWALALAKPAQPTNKTPGPPWSTSEPAYDRAKQLYMCSRVDYSNGTWSYTAVTLSSAYKASQEAETAARDAIETARNAETTANTAKQTADASKSESADAKNIAKGADATATQANATATAANQAATSAATAANTANQAAANAAGIADGKADVLIQSTAPATAMRKATTLWIDTTNGANTPKRWNGSAWVAVTDKRAVDAANAAAAAQTTADNAQTTANEAKTLAANADAKAIAATATANNAQTTADSKNTVYMQPTDPHDEADKASLIVPGDLWWQTSAKAPETYWVGEANNSVSVLVDHSGEIEHMWVWNGSRWNSHVLYAQDMLVNGSIVAELLAVDCVEARHISVGAIEADKLAVTALYGKVIKGGTFLTANERLIIDDAGLLLKDSGGNATITMLAGDGSATFRDVLIVGGTLTTPTLTAGELTGGTIDGATVTGSTVQTVHDANRGIKLTGGNLDIYRSNKTRFLRANESGLYVNDGSKDVLAFFNDAGTWKLKLAGPVTSGGEISGATVTGGTVQTSAQADTGIKLVGGNLDIYRSDQSLFMRANESGLLLKDGERTVLGFSRVLRTYWEGEPNNSVSVLSDGWQLTLDGAIQSGGEISGATITGGTVQTNAAANRGIKLADNNFDAYTAAGARFMRLNEAGIWFSDGSKNLLSFSKKDGSWLLNLDGPIQSGGEITGATITGTTVQTVAAANRGIKLKDNNLDVFSASGKLVMQANEAGIRVKDASGADKATFSPDANGVWNLRLNGMVSTGGAINGGTVTGSMIQTTAAANRGVKLYSGATTTGNLDLYRADGQLFLCANEDGLRIKDGTTPVFTFAKDEASKWVLSLKGAVQSGGEISGAVITAPTLQTSREEKTGLKFTSGGLVAYDADGDVTFTLDNAGQIMMAGALLSNAILTAPILQTDPATDRGIKIVNNTLTAFSRSGAPMLSLNGDTGSAVLVGGFKTAQSGRRLEITNSVYAGATQAAIRGYDVDGEAWHLTGTKGKVGVSGPAADVDETKVELGVNQQQPEFMIRRYSNGVSNGTAMHMIASRVDIVSQGDSNMFYGPRGVYINGRRIDWDQDWTNIVPLGEGIDSPADSIWPQYGQRAGLLCFRGRLKCNNAGDNTLFDLADCYEGFQTAPMNRTWIIGTMTNGVATTARAYIPANSTMLCVNNGPHDWVDIGSIVIGL